MVEVNQLRKKNNFLYYLRKNQTKNQTNAAQRGGGGGCNPLNPSPGSASEQQPTVSRLPFHVNAMLNLSNKYNELRLGLLLSYLQLLDLGTDFKLVSL